MNILKINKEALKLLGYHKDNIPNSINDFKTKYTKQLQQFFEKDKFDI